MYKRIKTLFSFPFTNAFYVYFLNLHPQEKKPSSSKHKFVTLFLFWGTILAFRASDPNSHGLLEQVFIIHSELEILARIQINCLVKILREIRYQLESQYNAKSGTRKKANTTRNSVPDRKPILSEIRYL